MNLDKEPQIEVWYTSAGYAPEKIVVWNKGIVSPMSKEYQTMIANEWQEFLKSRGGEGRDGVCFYMQSYEKMNRPDEEIGEGDTPVLVVNVKQGRFSTNQAFNRGKGLPNGRRVSTENGVAGIFTSMLYVLTKDDDREHSVLYGDKATYDPKNPRADQFAMTSIAGGIANDLDLVDKRDRIDMRKFWQRLVKTEAGEEYLGQISDMYSVGLTYRDVIPNRGFDLTGVVETNVPTGRALEIFRASPQFKKKPTPVRLTASSLCDFLQGERLQTFSNQALAAAYEVTRAVKGQEVADEVIEHINTHWKSYVHVLVPSLPERGGNVLDVLRERDYMKAA